VSKLTVLLGTTTLVAGACSVWLWQQLQAERDTHMQPVMHSELPLPVAPSASALAALPSQSIELPTEVSESAAAQPASPQARLEALAGQTRNTRERREMVRNGTVRVLYPDLEMQLGLTSAEANALYEMMANRASRMDVAALLGPSRLQKWQEVVETHDSNRQLEQVNGRMAQLNHPLDAQQNRMLGDTLKAERRILNQVLGDPPRNADRRARTEFDELAVNKTEESNSRVIAASRLFLDRDQIAALQSQLAGTVTTSRMFLEKRKALPERLR
jgi:hypothetical protein